MEKNKENKLTMIAMDIGGTKISAALVSASGHIEKKIERETISNKDELISSIAHLIGQLESETNEKILGVGIGVAGLIDHQNGLVVESPNLPLTGIKLRDLIHDQVNLPIFIDNDANLAALGEKAIGHGRELSDFIFLTLGTGVGGGIFVGGKLYRGALGAAAEIGHMVIQVNGERCGCGRLGCLESMASGTAVARMAGEVVQRMPRSQLAQRADGNKKNITAKIVSDLARAGDPESIEIFRVIGQSLGIGLGNIINIFSPEAIILGGGFAASSDLFLSIAKNVMLKTAIDPRADKISVEISTLGNDAGLYGAAELARLNIVSGS